MIPRACLFLAMLFLTSCSVILDNMFESSRDRQIREDTRNMKQGKPLRHYPSERRLKLDREDRMFEELQSM